MKPEDGRRIVERHIRRAKNERRPRSTSEALLQSGGFQIVQEPTKPPSA